MNDPQLFRSLSAKLALSALAFCSITLFLGLASSARAEQLSILKHSHELAMETSNGQVETCGVHFSMIGTSPSRKAMQVAGTITNTFFPGKTPSAAVLINATEVEAGKIVELTVKSASFFDNEKIDTRGFKRLKSAGKSYLGLAGVNENAPAFTDLLPMMVVGEVWLSFNTGDGSSDYVVRMPMASNATEILSQIKSCNAAGWKHLSPT